MLNKSTWTKLNTKYTLQNPWFRVRKDEVIRPDGEKGEYNVVECGKSIFVVPITEDNKVLLVKLFRYSTQHEGWEVPAGGVDPGEAPLAAAKRELQEETGLSGGHWQEVGSFDSMNGITDSMAHVFGASQFKNEGQNNQEEEGITEVRAFTFNEILQMIQDGRILDALSIAALMQFFIKFELMNIN